MLGLNSRMALSPTTGYRLDFSVHTSLVMASLINWLSGLAVVRPPCLTHLKLFFSSRSFVMMATGSDSPVAF